MQYVKLRHEILHARYDEGNGKWHLKIRRPGSGGIPEEFEDMADVVISAAGALSRWVWPDIDGLLTFKGKLMHSAAWDMQGQTTWQDSVKGWKDKKVGLIGTVCSSFSSSKRISHRFYIQLRALRRYKFSQSCKHELVIWSFTHADRLGSHLPSPGNRSQPLQEVRQTLTTVSFWLQDEWNEE